MSADRAILGAALAVALADGALLVLAFAPEENPGLLLSLHAILCAGLATFALVHRGESRRKSAFLILAFWTFFAGPPGALVAAVFAFAGNGDHARAFGEWFESQASGEADRIRALRSALLCRRLRIDGASAAQPHCDLITDGSVKQKHDALSVIQRRFDPALVRALRLAEADPDQSVRVLAATVAIKLQTRFASQIEDLQAAATEARTIDAWLALADAHARFGASGLLSVTDAREQFAMAAARHQDALDCACAADPARFPLVQQIVRVIEDQWPAPARPQAPEPRGQTFGGGLR